MFLNIFLGQRSFPFNEFLNKGDNLPSRGGAELFGSYVPRVRPMLTHKRGKGVSLTECTVPDFLSDLRNFAVSRPKFPAARATRLRGSDSYPRATSVFP